MIKVLIFALAAAVLPAVAWAESPVASPITVQGTNSGGTPVSITGTGTAGTPATGVVTVQGITNGTPQPVSGFDSGAVSATATPNSSSHAAGTSVGGLFSVTIARTAGGSGIITNLTWKSTGGAVTQLLVRLWQKSPTNTTCTDQTAFSGSDADDANLITAPFGITPAAPASTTGDSATYAGVGGVTWDYKNADSPTTQIVYACVVTTATDTADESKLVRLTLSGPQN